MLYVGSLTVRVRAVVLVDTFLARIVSDISIGPYGTSLT